MAGRDFLELRFLVSAFLESIFTPFAELASPRRLSENSLVPPEKNLKVFSDIPVSKS
jgi:hypothetical protein